MTTSDVSRHRAAPRADLATYVRLFEPWSRSGHRETLSTYQLGYLRGRSGPLRRRRPPLPLLQLLVHSDRSIDFADPETGFPGLAREPAAERVLTLWADDLLSVRHGDDWIYVVDAEDPFTDTWLELLAPAHGSPRAPYAVVTATGGLPLPAGEFRVADVEATTHTTLVRVEDRRHELHREAVAAPFR